MSLHQISSFAAGSWIKPGSGARVVPSAITGEPFATAGSSDLDMQAMLDYARETGGPALRKMTFHQRARMLKALAQELSKHKQALYDLSFQTGATQKDHLIDIDGGIGTMFVFASKGRREMPDTQVYLDGEVERLSREGTFLGQHICSPLLGAAIHINAFNFPVWGMLEKLAPTLLAGVPAIVKPATNSCYVAELAVRIMLESGLLPAGALQLVSGGLGDMLNRLDCQDVVSFTGSAKTALELRQTHALIRNSVRFVAEQDSLNASILGPDAVAGTPEFDLFVKEVSREMTVKAGQKCTAIRRIIAPEVQVSALIEALTKRLARVTIGDPRIDDTQMGPLISGAQKADVMAKADLIATESEKVFGEPDAFELQGEGVSNGAFVPPMLFYCGVPDTATHVHETEAFGPVSTIMGYRDVDHAIALANRGGGSLVTSLITHDTNVAREVVIGAAAFNGRIYINDRTSMGESTGHGSPLPHMVHGGPGRAGGGEELGGVRAVKHYMQRTAIQGSPDMLTQIGQKWVPGATEIQKPHHPFTYKFSELCIGQTLHTEARTITLEDIEHFANFTGDTFYAHMDEAAAERNPFFPGRVAHGYLVLSFAAGLFVEPSEGPVLANYGLDGLRFLKPVSPGDAIKVRLTVKQKTPRNEDYGEVRWHVTVANQNDEAVAEYDLLTMCAD
ncbi:phenylacetic acid degradation bifunctional protein PaaZ [Ruegeria arenilitoris]|uniref:phenylacetic acid degradation bifunctional protein PaaZ n=1 Tax=Ruegeria arenilitoris TaxID=1173585 RepID=UPI00147C64E9|nr:phenylacetic acid degradation bifunctional protein PaaZ [Ruegeria arenilitoris]